MEHAVDEFEISPNSTSNLARSQPRNNLQAANERPSEPITNSREGTSSSQRPTRTSSHRETPMTDPRHLSDLQDAVLNIRLKRRQLDSVLTTQLTAHPENEREERLGQANLSGVPPPPVSRTRFVDPENQRIGRTVDAWMRTLQPEIQSEVANQWQKMQERNGYPATTSGTDLSSGRGNGAGAVTSASRVPRARGGGDISIPLRRADLLQREHTARRLAAAGGGGNRKPDAKPKQASAGGGGCRAGRQPAPRNVEEPAPLDVDEAYLAQVYGKLWLDARRRALGAPYLRLATAPRPVLTTRAGPRVSRLDYAMLVRSTTTQTPTQKPTRSPRKPLLLAPNAECAVPIGQPRQLTVRPIELAEQTASPKKLTVEQTAVVRIPSVSTPREDRQMQTVSDVGVQAKLPAPTAEEPPRNKRLQYLEMRARATADYQTPDHLKRARGIQVDGASRDAPLQQEVAPSLEQFAEQARLPLDAEAESAVQLASLRSRQRLKERITSMVEQELLQQMLADLQARRAPPPPHPAPAEPEPADELELPTEQIEELVEDELLRAIRHALRSRPPPPVEVAPAVLPNAARTPTPSPPRTPRHAAQLEIADPTLANRVSRFAQRVRTPSPSLAEPEPLSQYEDRTLTEPLSALEDRVGRGRAPDAASGRSRPSQVKFGRRTSDEEPSVRPMRAEVKTPPPSPPTVPMPARVERAMMTAPTRDEELQTSLRPGVAMHPGVMSPAPRPPPPPARLPEEELSDSDEEEPSETQATPPGEATETVGDSVSEGQWLISASLGQAMPIRALDPDSLHRLNLDANGDSLEGTDFEADEDMPTPTVTSGGLRSDGEFRPARMRPADHRLLEDLRHAQEQPLPFAQATSLRAALRIPPDSRSAFHKPENGGKTPKSILKPAVPGGSSSSQPPSALSIGEVAPRGGASAFSRGRPAAPVQPLRMPLDESATLAEDLQSDEEAQLPDEQSERFADPFQIPQRLQVPASSSAAPPPAVRSQAPAVAQPQSQASRAQASSPPSSLSSASTQLKLPAGRTAASAQRAPAVIDLRAAAAPPAAPPPATRTPAPPMPTSAAEAADKRRLAGALTSPAASVSPSAGEDGAAAVPRLIMVSSSGDSENTRGVAEPPRAHRDEDASAGAAPGLGDSVSVTDTMQHSDLPGLELGSLDAANYAEDFEPEEAPPPPPPRADRDAASAEPPTLSFSVSSRPTART